MNIIAFSTSGSSVSINKQLLDYVLTYFAEDQIDIVNINDYEITLYNYDKEVQDGIPPLAVEFQERINKADLIIMGLAEHNGGFPVIFKNLFDWISRIPQNIALANKNIFLLSTSPGPRGGATVMGMASQLFPYYGGKVLATYTLPSFDQNFSSDKGVTNESLLAELKEKIDLVKAG